MTSSTPSNTNTKKWKSLFQLRRASTLPTEASQTTPLENDDEEDDDLILTRQAKCPSNRRPSAPAILADFKNFLTKTVSRKTSSSYGLCSGSKDDIHVSSDPIQLIALKEHSSTPSPSIVDTSNPPAFSYPKDPPQLLHKAGKKFWKKKVFSVDSSNPSAATGSNSNVLAKSEPPETSKLSSLNRIHGDAKESPSNNCQRQSSSDLFTLSSTKSLIETPSEVDNQQVSHEEIPPQSQASSDIAPSTYPSVKSSGGVVAFDLQALPPPPANRRNSDISISTSATPVATKKLLFQKRQRDIVQDDDSDEGADEGLFIRRHTIADMTVAAYGMVICGTDDSHQRYRGRIEKVKFGVPINEAFSHDIPATLLVLLLKVNKEGPLKKDIWRAPGNQAQVRKLSHIMQSGRLVNISNISVYTAASVIKKFLSKLPGGIFGSENEQELFGIVQQPDNEQQRNVFCRVICNLSVPSQHLLVLLFGTFRIISDSAETFGTRMTPDAIGISVAPSLFHTCIHDGQRAKLEDVMRFKLASQVISKIIQGFGYTNLFPRECYEFYARITGRTLRVDEHWHFTFQYPSITGTFSQPAIHRACESPPLGHEGDERGPDEPGPSCYHRRRNTDVTAGGTSSNIPSSNIIEPLEKEFAGQRLSASMGEVLIHTGYESDVPERLLSSQCPESFESTRSLTYLEWVHEKQTKRMRTRSEWFLSPVMPTKNNGASKSVDFKQQGYNSRGLLVPKDPDVQGSSAEDMQISPNPKSSEPQASSSAEEETPRQPVQELPETITTPTTSENEATTPLAKNQTPAMFFASQPGGPMPPLAVVAVAPTQRALSSSGVVRRKSWRTHYVRPNKSFDQESTSGKTEDFVKSSSHSTPARRSSMADFEVVETPLSDSSTRPLIRRKSSGSNGQEKHPVQPRRSTQI